MAAASARIVVIRFIFLFQFVIDFIRHRLQPLIRRAVLDVGVVGQVLHPTIFGGSVPVLHLGMTATRLHL